ncbi:type II toxin-antitoxin system HicB family antitoxin [Paenibacillus larvae]
MTKKYTLTVMYEEDKMERNVSAYVPALRMGVCGDTIQEARESITDLIMMELEKGKELPIDNAIIEILKMEVPVNN